MYLNILRKDLKRAKTMNVLLLLFTILASMFVASGLSNTVNVLNGTSYFMDKAGVGDYVVITQNQTSNVEEILNQSSAVKSYKKEDVCWATSTNVRTKDGKQASGNGTILFQPVYPESFVLFTLDDQPLEHVNPGEIYVTSGVLESAGLHVGDELIIDFQDVHLTVTITGEMKDALMGSELMGNQRFVLSDEDYQHFQSEACQPYLGSLFQVETDAVSELKSDLASGEKILFEGPRSLVQTSYVMELIVAMVVLVLSVCLCIVSFVLMKFVISFAISEDFHEIGVMKAIGIGNLKIRGMYMFKYFVMAVVGGFIGFLISMPFGDLLMESVTKKMVLGNDIGILLNALGALIVVLVISGFAYLSTRKVKKLTPVDAIRSGSTGERYGKKSKLSLTRMPFTNAVRLALNDIISSPKRYITILLPFFLCSIFVFGLVEVTDTMRSDRLITTLCKKSDVYVDDEAIGMEILSEEGNQILPEKLADMEAKLQELNMPGKVCIEVWYKYSFTVGDRPYNGTFTQNKYISASEYEYTKGSAPQNRNEIAITEIIKEEYDIELGDTITIDFGSEKLDCIVVGYFQSMNQLGSVIRLHEDAPTDMSYASAFTAEQIDFDDKPDTKTIEERIEVLKGIYGEDKVYNAAEYCDEAMKVASTMEAVQYLLLVISGLVVIMVTILMERSFIYDETSQIAMLKSLGFTDRFVIKWQTYRFLFVTLISEILAIALTYPVTKLWCDPIWKMMGAQDVDYYFKPLSLLVIYPGILILINLVTAFLTAQITRKIKCNQVRNVE